VKKAKFLNEVHGGDARGEPYMETGSSVDRVRELVDKHGIERVRVSFSDVHGVSRGRYVPIRAYLNQVRHNGMEFSNAIFAMDSGGGIAPGTTIPMDNGFPNWRLVVDESTFHPLPWRVGEARVFADMVTPDGQPVGLLPRQVLRNVVGALTEQGLQVQVGMEYEFYLLNRTPGQAPTPLDSRVQYNSELEHASAMERFAPLMQGLRDLGIEVEAFGEEYAPSQYEINLHHGPAAEATDQAFMFKQAVKEVLTEPGVVASFMSKPFADSNGSGCHIHVSITDGTGRNLFADDSTGDGLSRTCRAFIGGLLAHAEGLMALTNPTINCYKRVVPGRFAPVMANWGYDNRNCVVRITASRGAGTHIEFRAPSAVSNPYVAVAAVLVAGWDGIQQNLDPGQPEQSGISPVQEARPLPSSLSEALDALAADEALTAGLGPAFINDYIAIKRNEMNRFAKAVTNWEWDEYIDLY
jgi:glutamine synthetase